MAMTEEEVKEQVDYVTLVGACVQMKQELTDAFEEIDALKAGLANLSLVISAVIEVTGALELAKKGLADEADGRVVRLPGQYL